MVSEAPTLLHFHVQMMELGETEVYLWSGPYRDEAVWFCYRYISPLRFLFGPVDKLTDYWVLDSTVNLPLVEAMGL